MFVCVILLLMHKGHDNDFHSTFFKGETNFHRFSGGILGNELIGFHPITFLYFVEFS